MVKRIVPNIRSGNPAIGLEFYTDALGLEVVTDKGWIITLASPENPTAQLTIVDSDPALPHPDYSIEVADVDVCYQRTQEQGWDILHPLTVERWGVKRFFVRDPHGRVANVMQDGDGLPTG
jgi:catechol 2,3-dioxygenase-like lactoylglutathione lyase family enzyme